MSKSNIRLGILCNQVEVFLWQRLALVELLKVVEVEKLYLIYPKNQISQEKSGRAYRFFRNRFVKIPLLQRTTIRDLFQNIEELNVDITRTNGAEYFDQKDINYLKNCELDLIVRFGFNIIKGDILNVAKYGIWSFHHGDPEYFRGGPPGFWEIYEDKKLSGFMLQQLSEELDAGKILDRGYISTTSHHYGEQWNSLLAQSVFSLRKAWVNSVLNRKTGEKLIKKGKLYRYPNTKQTLRFIYLLFKNRCLLFLKKRFQKEIWSIGICERKAPDLNPDFSQIYWLSNQNRHSYFADPFFDSASEEFYIIAEHYDYKTKEAHLIRTHFNAVTKNWNSTSGELSYGKHLSFPFTFTWNDQPFMIPESLSENKTLLFKLDKGQWILHQVLLQEFALIDPVLFSFNNQIWILGSKKEFGSNALFLFYANSFEEPFVEHPLNPVICHPGHARNAGSLVNENKQLIRPAQSCISTYGEHIVLRQISHLSESDYQEKNLQIIQPEDNWTFNRGLHTINYQDNFVVFDAKKYRYFL